MPRRVTGEMVEGDVAAAREENPVDAGVERIPAIIGNERGNQHRHASRLLNS